MKVYNSPTLFHKKEKTSLFASIQHAATIGTWKLDLIHDQLDWSNVTKRIHGVDDNYTPSLEKALKFYKSGYSKDTITKLVQNCIIKFEKYDVELEIITAKGEEKWVRAIGMPIIENGKCIFIYGLFQDIDEKTRALKALSYKEEQFRKTFEFAIIGMAIIDLWGKWIKSNLSLQKMLGYSGNELKLVSLENITHPDDLDDSLLQLQNLLSGKIENYQSEKRLVHKNGTTVWCKVSFSLVRNDMGEPLNFIAQVNDVSNFKNASDKVNELLSTSESQNKRLLNFAHIVSHNLRSHSGNLEMLVKFMETEIPESTKNEFFPMIKNAISNLGETVENLNEVAILNTKAALDIVPLNLRKFAEKAATNIEAIAVESNSKIYNYIDPNITVNCIAAYLDSIVLNFLTNCIKYRHPQRNLIVELTTDHEEDYVVLYIKDNGIGIDLKLHGEKLFGMYKTFHKHKDARGLGLFITKNQLDAIGGKIEVISTVGQGTTFKIYFKHEND